MKKLFAGVLMAACFVSGLSAESVTDEEWFPILAWGPLAWFTPEGRALVQEDFDLMKECGFTIAGFSGPEYLDMIADAGLKTYFWDDPLAGVDLKDPDNPELPGLVADALARVEGRPEVIGIFLRDEPVSAALETLGVLSREIRKRDPDMVPYINLYPTAGSDDGNRRRVGCTYEEYLEQYAAKCDMPFISYDFYSMPRDRGDELDDRYWLNLEQVRDAARKAGVPFYYCTMGVTHFRHRQPTRDDLNFEVYSALLYGARGLAIFTYFTPPIGNYSNAPISEFGERTQVWYDLKTVLKSVHNRAALLNNLESVAVYHIPRLERERGTRAPDENSLLESVSNDGDARFAVGEFVHRTTGQKYVMILNKDLNNAHHLDLKWRGEAPAKIEINPASRRDEWRSFWGEERWVAPGHAQLLRLTW